MSLIVSKNPFLDGHEFNLLDVKKANETASSYRMLFNEMTLIADGDDVGDFVGLLIKGYHPTLSARQKQALRRKFLHKVFFKKSFFERLLFVGDFFPFTEKDIPLDGDIYWLDDVDDYGFLANLNHIRFIQFGPPVILA